MKEIKNDNFKNVNKLEFKCTCKHCGCQFEYSDSEIWHEEIQCPNCDTYCKHKKYLNSLDENKRAIGKFGITTFILFILTSMIVFFILIGNFINTESSPKYELTFSRCGYTWIQEGYVYWTPDGDIYTGDDLSYAPEGTYIVYTCEKCGKDGQYIVK